MTAERKTNPMMAIPIDPEKLNESAVNHEQNEAAVVNKRWIKAEAFIAIWDLARLIAEGTHFQKKSRIVLEYDPQVEKFSVVTITEPCSQKTEEVPNNKITMFRDGEDIVIGQLGSSDTIRASEKVFRIFLDALTRSESEQSPDQISGTVLDLTDEAMHMHTSFSHQE